MPRSCHPLRWIHCLCWAMPWSSSKQTCIRCTSKSFFKKRWGIKQGPHFFFGWPHQKKNLVQTLVFSTKEETIQLKSFFSFNKNQFLLKEMGVVIIPKVEGTFPFSMGDALVSPWKRFFSKG